MIDLVEIMRELSLQRPVFHSEADFQHALAMQIHMHLPDCNIRLEYPFGSNRENRLDILVFGDNWKTAIELKYKTTDFFGALQGDIFVLKGHSANDIGRYEFLKDVERLEGFVSQNLGTIGYSILLTNDSAYWNPSNRDLPIDSEFRLTEGRKVVGTLRWGEHAGKGTTKGIEAPISIAGAYDCRWKEYSEFQQGEYMQGSVRFRYLMLEVKRLD